MIYIAIKFGEPLLWFSAWIVKGLRRYIKHSKVCFWVSSDLQTPRSWLKLGYTPVFFNHFSVLGNRMKNASLCLTSYFSHPPRLAQRYNKFANLFLYEDLCFRKLALYFTLHIHWREIPSPLSDHSKTYKMYLLLHWWRAILEKFPTPQSMTNINVTNMW